MTAAVDGRKLRGMRSRDAVVDALLSLYDDGHVRPGAALIAERAGVSQSSVFRHFRDLEDLLEAAIARQWLRIGDRFAAPLSTGDLDERISALVTHRLAFHDVAAPAIRAGRLIAPDSPSLNGAFTARRALFRQHVATQFATELAALTPADRRRDIDALDAASSFEQVEYLRSEQGFSDHSVATTLAHTLRSLLRGAPS